MKRNRVPWVVGGILILLLVIGSFACGKKEKKPAAKPPPPETARALTVPASRARSVVVPPCNAPASEIRRRVEGGEPIPGATTLELPRGRGVRHVLVPHCRPGAGVTSTPGNIPSAAFVLATGEKPPEGEGGGFTVAGFTAKTQLILTSGSTTETVVVSPCAKGKTGERDVVLGGEQARSPIAVAPSC